MVVYKKTSESMWTIAPTQDSIDKVIAAGFDPFDYNSVIYFAPDQTESGKFEIKIKDKTDD